MKEIQVAVIGSGSTYAPELVDGFIKAKDSLKLTKIVFMDIDERKRNIVGELCIRMLRAAGIECPAILTDCLEEALTGADFVVTQFRVGKLPARHKDESIPLKYDLVGQETTGIGGFFKALRTIPVMAEIASAMERLCPDAWLINFTNPSGIIAEYLQNHTKVKSLGLCNCPINMIDDVKERCPGKEVSITYLGLNHLSYITSVIDQGKEILPELVEEGFSVQKMANIKGLDFDPELIRTIGAIPTSYLHYYYNESQKLKEEKEEGKTRAEECMEIEEDLLKIYEDAAIHTKPALLDKRGGHKYSLAAVSLIDSIANDKQDVQVVNTINKGALSFMGENDIVEVAAVIGKDGAAPVPVTAKTNEHIVSLIQSVKQYERYTVEAAIKGDDRLALLALLSHPLVGDFVKASQCYEEMKEAHKEYLPQFYK